MFSLRLSCTLRSILNIAKSLEHRQLVMSGHRQESKMAMLFDSSSGLSDEKKNHLFEESAALNVYDTTVTNLAAGCPGPDLLSRLPEFLTAASKHRMEIESKAECFLFQYGPAAGLWGMRQELAKFLTRQYQDTVRREDLVLTCGATHGLHLLISTLLAPNAVIFVEEYTYMIALHLFKEFPHYRVVSVPLDGDGLNVKEFARIAAEVKNGSTWEVSVQKPCWAMLYCIPHYHNPTGSLLPPEKCKKLVEAARSLDVLVVCDDVYNLLHYSSSEAAPPPSRLFSFDRPEDKDYGGGNVVSNGSFSKLIAPGLRVGWMEMPRRLAKRIRQSGILQSGGSVNNVMFGIIQSAMELGLADVHLKWYRTVYKERMEVFCSSLLEHLPPACSFLHPTGGYFVWVRAPVDCGAFLSWCAERGGPGAVPSARFSPAFATGYYVAPEMKADSLKTDGSLTGANVISPAMRLSIGFHDKDTLKAAAEDLGNKLKLYMEELKENV